MQPTTPSVRDVLLIGGGHAHVQVLKHFAMHPVPGVRLTLVSEENTSPYSGMVPGYLAGHYNREEIEVALEPLCQLAQARFICAEVTGLERSNQRVKLRNRPPIRYDILSLNCGSKPDLNGKPGIAVKPISRFLSYWANLKAQVEADSQASDVTVVGAGAGGIEVAFACRARLPASTKVSVIGPSLLPGSNRRAVRVIAQAFHDNRIDFLPERVVDAFSDEHTTRLTLGNGELKSVQHLLWVTDVRAPDWLMDSGLDSDEKGFICVDEQLRTVTDDRVFAVGDVAHLQGQERAKAGVYAVRAAPTLAHNLMCATQGLPLTGSRCRYTAQHAHLTVIGLGSPKSPDALAIRGPFAFKHRMFWRLKAHIDRRFIERYNNLPKMAESQLVLPKHLAEDLPADLMRCGGCGAKVAADPLRRVLARLPKQHASHVTLGIGDDAAQVLHGTGSTLLSVDGFRAMIDDPYLLGRICAHHSLNDLFAMGARPSAALALATIPLMAEAMMEDDLYQLLHGVVDVLEEHGAVLVGGHSSEGAELSIALTVTGTPGATTLTKSGGRPGDVLVLTKPLGTGVILASAMRGLYLPGATAACLNSMNLSNSPAASVFKSLGVTALTDVTGFGLLGHIGEMQRASKCGVTLNVQNIPALPGALEMLERGIRSSIAQANALALGDFTVASRATDTARLALLSDPQTSGGLLASVPPNQLDACLKELTNNGVQGVVIGQMESAGLLQII